MGGKTSKSTQTVSIPPEVLARYNAVNARAEEAAGRPFQPYSYNPADFVAQLTPTQLAGIQNVNYAAGQAQPYYEEATNQLMGAQMGAVPYYAQAGQDIGFGQQMGMGFQQQALQNLYGAQAAAAPLNYRAGSAYEQAYAQGQPFIGGAVGQFAQGQAQAQPYQQAAGMNIAGAQDIGSQLAQQAYAQQAMAGATAQPINQQAYRDLAAAYGTAQPLNQAAVQQYYSGLAAAQPLQNYALSTLGRAGGIGEQVSGQALGTLGQGLDLARPVQMENLARADAVYGAAQPFINRADLQYQRGLGGAEALQQYALSTLGQGQDISQALSGQALGSLQRGELRAEPLQQLAQGIYGQAYQAAQPFTQAALQQYYGGLGIAGPIQQAALAQMGAATGTAAPLTQAAVQNIAAAQAGATPYQRYATELGLAAARPVTPGALTGREIQQYMSPYMSSVVGQTQALLNQQANQAQAEQLGNAIRSGAFGGDRAGIAAANLQQQQQLAQGKVLSDLLQSGYGQALGTAQQQQQLALGAEQANRAAQQAAAGQLLGVGQAGFGQGITAAQQQAALAQQLFGQQLGAGQAQAGLAQQLFGQQAATGQNIAGLGQQAFGQGLSTGQAQQALAQQLFGQGATTAAQQQAVSEALFGRGATSAAQQAALAQQTFGQNQAVAQGLAALGQQQFGQGMANIAAREATAQNLFGQSAQAAQQQAAIAQNLFGQGATQAAQQAALAQQQFAQNQAVGQNVAQMAQQLYGQGTGTAQAQAAIGQQAFQQQMQQAQQQAALSQLLFGQGTTAAQQQAALGQQLFGQGITGGQALLGAGQQAYQQGMGLGAAQQQLAQQLFGQGLSASQQQAALGQQGFAQQLAAAQARQGLGQGLYGMGAGTAQQLAALGAGAQGAALQGAQAQLAAGQAQQQTAQAGLQALYNQFLQQQAYPFQVAQFLGNIAMGTGALSGSTTTAVTPGGLFSDVRMKENIRKVGETFDKQPIYAYNYKGDDKTQMGMLAQEVEKRHPEAVGLAGGMKTVDYDKATRDSVRKPVVIDAEYTSSEGGPVLPHRAGEGFARGGYANGGSPGLAAPGDMAALLAAQAQMFGPFSGAAMPTGGMPGMPGYVPGATLPVSELVTPGAMPSQPSAIEQMRAIADIGKTGQEIYQKYKDKQTNKSTVSSPATKAAGGAANPVPTTLGIPDEPTDVKKLETPGSMPKGRTAMEDVKDIAQIAAAVMAMSDSRMKEDIKHIGNTYDGQKIYSYRFKGEPQTHIGLLAQEVEKKHPDAVGSIKGVKMVDYDAATADAADRAVQLARKKADGGSAVTPYGVVPTALGIPTQSPGIGKLSVPDMPAGRSPIDDLKDIVGLAKSVSDINEARKEKPEEEKPPATKYAGGRAGYATDGTVEDPTFAERFIPGIQTKEGVEANRRAMLKPIQERIIDNPLLPHNAIRTFLNPPKPAGGLAPTSAAVTAPAATAPPATTSAATTPPSARTPTATAAPQNVPPPPANVALPSSRFANLPEGPVEGLGAAAAPAAAAMPPAGLAAPSMPASLTGERDLGMAPMLGGTAPARKTPTDAEVVAKDRSAPVESRMTAFLNWVRQPENFIPLATGVAAATAAPTRNTFVALAQGLGAGAQAYQPVLQKQADLAKTKAEIEGIQIATAVARAGIPTTAIISDAQGRTLGIRVYVNNQPEIIPPGEFFRRQNAGEKFQFVPGPAGVAEPAAPAPGQQAVAAPAAVKPATTAPAATGAAQRPIYEVLPADLAQSVIQRANDVQSTGIPSLAAAKENNPFTEQAISANAQRSNRQQRNILAKSFADLPPGQSGIFAEQIANPIFNWINSTLTSFGVSPEFLRENIRDPQDLANQQVINKITTQLATQMQAEGGGVSLGKFTALLESIPRLYNTKEGQAELVASIYTQAQRELDLDRFYNMYRDRLQTEGGLNAAQSGYAGRGLEAEFSRRQDPTYGIEKSVISKMFMDKVRTPDGQEVPLLSYVISQGGNIPAGLQRSIRDKYSKKDASGKVIYDASEILRYFGGG